MMFKRLRYIIVMAMLLFSVMQTAAQVAMPDTVCAGTVRLYSVNDPTVPSTYTWKIDGVTQSTTTNAISITWNTPGTFIVTVQERNAAGCEGDIRSGTVTVNPLPVVNAGSYPVVCGPVGLVTLSGSPAGGNFSGTGVTGNIFNPAIAGVGIHTITYVYTNATGCSNSASTTIRVEPLVPPLRYTTLTAAVNVPMQLIARNFGNNYTYNWAPAVGLNSYVVYNPVFNYNLQTEYTIAITSPVGCQVVDTLLVRIPGQSPLLVGIDIFVPKAWSPNGDGHNDQLRPLTLNIREIKYFRIFNRWGELVFETNIMGQGWNGIYKGKPAAMDTYTWTAEAVGNNGQTVRRSGNSILLR